MKTMRLIALVAMTHMLGACALQGGVSSPASPEPARTDGTAAPSAADAALVHQAAFDGWSMPEPGPFDPNAVTTEDIFKACEDIPDEVFEELGIVQEDESGDSFEPYLCGIQVPNVDPRRAVIHLETWPSSVQEMLDFGIWVEQGDIAELPGGRLVKPTNAANRFSCQAVLETGKGTIVSNYLTFDGEPNCGVAAAVLIQLFGGEQIGNQG